MFSKRRLAAAASAASSPSPGLWARGGINDGSQPANQPAIIHARMTYVPLPWCVDDSGGSSRPFRGLEVLRHLRRGRCRRSRRAGPSRAISPRTQPAETSFCWIVTPLTAGRITARTVKVRRRGAVTTCRGGSSKSVARSEHALCWHLRGVRVWFDIGGLACHGRRTRCCSPSIPSWASSMGHFQVWISEFGVGNI